MNLRLPRVCMVVPVFPRRSETFIVSKLLGLRSRGAHVSVACLVRGGKRDHFPELQGRRDVWRSVRRAWPDRPRWIPAILWPLGLVLAVWRNPRGTLSYLARGLQKLGPRQLAKRFYADLPIILSRPQVIHFEFGSLAPERMYLKDLLGCRIVVSFRGYDINYVGLNRPNWYAEVFARADLIHFLGEDLRRRAERRGYTGTIPHRLIPPAVDPSRFRPAPRQMNEGGEFRILSAGRLTWKKGYEFALHAVAILRGRGVPVNYRIVGEGEYAEALYFCRRQLGLDDAVEFQGWCSHDRLPEAYQWADVFLHAAVSEGFCNAVMEAQASGLAVVTSDADGLAENVQNGLTGWVVPRRDPEALAARLQLLYERPEMRRHMGAEGRRRAVERFSLDEQVARFERLYRDVFAPGEQAPEGRRLPDASAAAGSLESSGLSPRSTRP